MAAGALHIKVHVGQQIDLIEQHGGGNVKHERIFLGLVVALGNAQKRHLAILAHVELGRADQIADVFDEKDVEAVRSRLLAASWTWELVRWAAALGVDLHGLGAGGGHAAGIVVGLQVALDDGHVHLVAQVGQSAFEQRGFARPGRAHEIEDQDAAFGEKGPEIGGNAGIGLQDVAHHGYLHDLAPLYSSSRYSMKSSRPDRTVCPSSSPQ
jgi:hypothetical protein